MLKKLHLTFSVLIIFLINLSIQKLIEKFPSIKLFLPARSYKNSINGLDE